VRHGCGRSILRPKESDPRIIWRQLVDGSLFGKGPCPPNGSGPGGLVGPASLERLTDQVWEGRDTISAKLEADMPALKEKARENAKVAVELISKAAL
jgi:hypothetical protein